jgi:lipopolysaccharide export system protein LptA
MKKNKKIRNLFLCLGLLALSFLNTPALAKENPKAPKREPIDVVAKHTEYDGKLHTYTVFGDVRVDYRDISVFCQKAVIYFNPLEDQVNRIVFLENVDVHWKSNNFKGEVVTYFVPTQRLVAEGGTKTRINVSEIKQEK